MPGAVPTEDRRADGWRKIRHYTYVERSFEDVWALLARSPGQVLGRASEASYVREASLHVKRAGVEVTRDVRLRFGGIVCDQHRARQSLRWEDAHHPRLFPVLEAVLELASLDSGRRRTTQIGIVGRYLDAAPGVVRAEVHPLTGMATVEFDPELCNPVRLLEDLEDDQEWFRDGPEPDQAPAPTPGSDV
jgi:hypothetical protein